MQRPPSPVLLDRLHSAQCHQPFQKQGISALSNRQVHRPATLLPQVLEQRLRSSSKFDPLEGEVPELEEVDTEPVAAG